MSHKKDWAIIDGPGMWRAIHIMALECKSPEEKKLFVRFFKSICEKHRCGQCREHCKQNMSKMEESGRLILQNQDEHAAFAWSYLFHDMVNEMLGKPRPTYDEALAMYTTNVEVCTVGCGAHSGSESQPKGKK